MTRPLFVANAGNHMGRGLAIPAVSEHLMFDKPGALSRRGGAGLAGRSIFGLAGFFKNMGQGACAGLLTLLGATHLAGVLSSTETPAALLSASIDKTTLESVSAAFLASGGPGILEIIGAAALFLNAGRGAARIIGLLAFVALALGHANGVSHAEFLQSLTAASEFVTTFLANVAGSAFLAPAP